LEENQKKAKRIRDKSKIQQMIANAADVASGEDDDLANTISTY